MRFMNYEALSGKSILLLGKTRALKREEFDTLLKLHKIERVGSYTEGVALIIEGRMMNPYEEAESAELYESKKVPIAELSEVEEWLCRSIEPNRLLMSLKLSRNQERLVAFLQNPYITHELFFKLLQLYDWHNEGLFDNDTNRDVTAAIIGRFYVDLERNHNVQYAMSGLAHLIERYGNAELIGALADLPPVARELKNPHDRSLGGILDAMALHPDTPEAVLRILINGRAALLAHREPLKLEEELLSLHNDEVNTILSQNRSLSSSGADRLEQCYPCLIASNILLNEERFERFVGHYSDALASNRTLSGRMQHRLLDQGEESVWKALCANSTIERTILDRLFETGRFLSELASNSSLTSEQLEALYETQNPEVLLALASNPSTPIGLLYQLSLDRRYERSVKTNPAFGKHIQTHNIGWH